MRRFNHEFHMKSPLRNGDEKPKKKVCKTCRKQKIWDGVKAAAAAIAIASPFAGVFGYTRYHNKKHGG
jgi:hypothetical protein